MEEHKLKEIFRQLAQRLDLDTQYDEHEHSATVILGERLYEMLKQGHDIKYLEAACLRWHSALKVARGYYGFLEKGDESFS